MRTTNEFVCVECGQLIWRAIPLTETEPRLCCCCLEIPGWVDDPHLRRALDPDGRVDPAKILTAANRTGEPKCGA